MDWIREHRRALTYFGVLAGIAVTIVLVRVLWTGVTAPPEPTALTPSEQAVAAVENANPDAWPSDTPGMLPLTLVSLSEFKTDLEGQVASVDNFTGQEEASVAPTDLYVASDGDVAAFVAGPPGFPTGVTATNLIDGQASDLVETAEQAGINVNVVPATTSRQARMDAASAANRSSMSTVFLVGIAVIFVIAIAVSFGNLLRRRREMGGGGFGGDSVPGKVYGDTEAVTGRKARRKAKGEIAEIPKTRFTDVAGCEEAVEDLREIVDFLKNRERFASVGAAPPAGAVLVGPPGTGKTLLARAVAGEAGVPFFAMAGSDFIEKYVGVGAGRVRSAFSKARKSPGGAIIFIDEIDAVGRARGGHNSHPEQENTLNALLVEMDGFSESNIIVLAATNRHDMLDPALVRPGRLDREVHVPLPDRIGRENILAVHAKDKPLADDIDFTLIARRTPGMSGAELARVVNEACLAAVRAERDVVTNDDFDHAIATASMGRARTSAVVTDHDRTITAWHEAGHTVAALMQPEADPPVSVSIIPRGPAGGVTWMAQGDDLFLTRKKAHARLVVALAGRAAEEALLDGEFTSGAHGDLTTASRLAFAMATQYGMTDLGLMVREEGLLRAGGQVTDQAVDKVEEILARAQDEARALLGEHYPLLEAVALALLDRDTLNAADLADIQATVRVSI